MKPAVASAPVAPPDWSALCPYCHADVRLADASEVYRQPGFGQLYLCARFPACDAFVGVHRGTDIPKGTLANRPLRELRKCVHAAFDVLWKSRRMTRPAAYRHLARILGLKPNSAHIGWMTAGQCQMALEVLAKGTA